MTSRCAWNWTKSRFRRISGPYVSLISLLRILSASFLIDYFLDNFFPKTSPSSEGMLLDFLTSAKASPMFVVLSVAKAALMITLNRINMNEILLSSNLSLRVVAS